MVNARIAIGALWLLLSTVPAYAVRPFITDDARVVGRKQAQMETWIRGDSVAFQHWALTSYGPTDAIELTAGMVHGVHCEHDRRYSVAGPLIQAKYLLRRPEAGSWPGIAVSAGAFAPIGNGPFKPHGWDTFAYAAVTESITEGDGVLIHGNVGFVNSSIAGRKSTWGGGHRFVYLAASTSLVRCSQAIPMREALELLFRLGSATSSATTSRSTRQ